MSESIAENVEWSAMLEKYFADTAEKAHCLSWCHKQAEALYSHRRNFIDLPVIIISSLVGFMSVGSTTMFAGREMESSVSLGILSLFVSVLNTTGSYFGWSKRAEGHRISAIQYSKMYRYLNIEMSLPRQERMTPHDLLKYTKECYDRLQEISPMIPPEIIAKFKEMFKDEKDISKPEECNGLEKVVIYEEHFSSNPLHQRETPVMSPLPVPHLINQQE